MKKREIKMYKIKFTLGSAYGSGHGKKEEYIVESNISGEKLVEVHNDCLTKLGFEISDIVGDYDNRSILPNILVKLFTINILKKDDEIIQELHDEAKELGIIDFDITVEKISELYSKMKYLYLESIESSVVLSLWLDIIKYLEPSFKYYVCTSSDIFDLKSFITGPGYGLYH